jgi:hypothetical protein
MLPDHAQTSVALAYASGIVVTYVPWQYGKDAPTFSQTQSATHYEQMVDQTPSGAMTFQRIGGIPSLAIEQNFGGQENPGSIDFQLGTENSNAVTLTVFGRRSATDLETVAASIASQWEQANS